MLLKIIRSSCRLDYEKLRGRINGGEGRVAIVPNVGIFEWEVIYDAETPQDTED